MKETCRYYKPKKEHAEYRHCGDQDCNADIDTMRNCIYYYKHYQGHEAIDNEPASGIKLHWFNFTFQDDVKVASQCIGYSQKNITASMIAKAKKSCSFTEQEPVMVSLLYLGHMTEKEFNGDD